MQPTNASWPNLPVLLPGAQFTPEQHAAHTSPRGIPNPDYFMQGEKSTKMAKGIMKFANKPHFKMTSKPQRKMGKMTRRKRKER